MTGNLSRRLFPLKLSGFTINHPAESHLSFDQIDYLRKTWMYTIASRLPGLQINARAIIFAGLFEIRSPLHPQPIDTGHEVALHNTMHRYHSHYEQKHNTCHIYNFESTNHETRGKSLRAIGYLDAVFATNHDVSCQLRWFIMRVDDLRHKKMNPFKSYLKQAGKKICPSSGKDSLFESIRHGLRNT